jgi:hypothetical protein
MVFLTVDHFQEMPHELVRVGPRLQCIYSP